ncbi:MAG TPA: hypothetical protein VK504_07530 [Vicinamibacterales bacterium]|nr:hypothetical protein [Vicinamibacterales bacterium]
MSMKHPQLYPDEHGDWAAANRGAQIKADLDDIARDLFSELCEGDGAHSEELDRALIVKHLRRAMRLAVPPGAAAG